MKLFSLLFLVLYKQIHVYIYIFNIVALIFVLSCFVLGLKLYLLSSCHSLSASKLIMLNVTHIYMACISSINYYLSNRAITLLYLFVVLYFTLGFLVYVFCFCLCFRIFHITSGTEIVLCVVVSQFQLQSFCKETNFFYKDSYSLNDLRISIAMHSNLTFYIGKLIIKMFECYELFSIHSLVTI